MKNDRIIALILFCLSCTLLWLSYASSAGGYQLITCCGMTLLSLLLFLFPSDATLGGLGSCVSNARFDGRVAVAVLLFVLFLLGASRAFYLSLLPFFVGMELLLGIRGTKRVIGSALAAVLIVFCLFNAMLGLPLPTVLL